MKARLQFSLRTLLIVVAVAAVVCGTIVFVGPPLAVVGYLEGVYPVRMPNPLWWAATFVELLGINIWYAIKKP